MKRSGDGKIRVILGGEGNTGNIGSIRRVGQSWGPGGQCVVFLDPSSVTFTPREDGAVVTASIVSQQIVEDGVKKTVPVNPPQRVSAIELALDAESRATLLKAAGNPGFKGEFKAPPTRQGGSSGGRLSRRSPSSRASARAGAFIEHGEIGDLFGH